MIDHEEVRTAYIYILSNVDGGRGVLSNEWLQTNTAGLKQLLFSRLPPLDMPSCSPSAPPNKPQNVKRQKSGQEKNVAFSLIASNYSAKLVY